MWRVATGCAVGVAFALGLIVLVPAVLGFQRYVITSGSMTGSYDRGALVFDRVVPTRSLRAGDVITFQPPGRADLVTHRIVALRRAQGTLLLRTKGDANPVVDPWGAVTLRSAEQARVAFHIPYVGYALAALSERRTRMVVIGGPALLIALVTLAGLWRTSGVQPSASRP